MILCPPRPSSYKDRWLCMSEDLPREVALPRVSHWAPYHSDLARHMVRPTRHQRAPGWSRGSPCCATNDYNSYHHDNGILVAVMFGSRSAGSGRVQREAGFRCQQSTPRMRLTNSGSLPFAIPAHSSHTRHCH